MMNSECVEREDFSRGLRSWMFYWHCQTEKAVRWSSCS